jgi:hypothetical protein
VGYVEDAFEGRTMLAGFFSILLDEGRERRIDNRIADQPF